MSPLRVGAGRRAALARAADPLLARRVAVGMFGIGSLTALAGVWLTQSSPGGRWAQAAVSALLALTALVLALAPPTRRVVQVAIPWGIALIGVLISFTQPLGMAPFFFLWPVVYTAYFGTKREALAVYLWMIVTLGVALTMNADLPMRPDTFVGTSSNVGFMCALVAGMTSQEARLRGELAAAAETDPLTGLLNRRSFDPRLELLVSEARDQARPLAVVMFDLDHFKRLNDDHGHGVGDEALRAVAAVLSAASRDGDLVSRVGGEEFAVALPGADPANAVRYAARVAEALSGLVLTDGATPTTSAGIATVGPDAADVEAVLHRADDALYAAKDAGRNRCAVWDGELVVHAPFGGEAASV